MAYRGVVKGNTVLLEEGAHLPDGSIVEVRPLESVLSKAEAIEQLLTHPITSYVGIDEVIEEEKREREERDGEWLRNTS